MNYKEKLEKAKELYPTANADQRYVLECLFPELEKNRDERILEIIKHCIESRYLHTSTIKGISQKECFAWLEKQGETSEQIHYWTEEEIEPIISDYLRGAEHYGGMIARLRCLKPKSLEKQGESYTKRDIDDAYVAGMAFAKSELEKQGEQNLANSAKTCKKSQRMVSAEAKEALYDKPAWSEEDETSIAVNSPDAYRIGFADGEAHAKEEMTTTWSEEDKNFMYDTLSNLTELKDRYGEGYGNVGKCINWLKSLKKRIGG